ncbi:MAG: hypothetical protein AB8H79_09945, partial [Myxococcota bacterium]
MRYASIVLALVLPTAFFTQSAQAAEVELGNDAAAELPAFLMASCPNIKRKMVKQRIKTYRPPYSRAITQDDGEGESASSVDFDVTYTDESGDTVTTSETASTPKVEKVYFDWTPPVDFEGGTVSLGCTDCGDDGFSDVAIELGTEEDWDGDNEDIEDGTLTARAWKRGNGDYRFRLKGKPVDVASLNFDADGNTPAASFTVDGDTTDYQFTREVWQSDLDMASSVLDDQVVFVEYSSRDEDGTLLDREGGTLAPLGEQRDGMVLDRLKLTENGAGNLKVLAQVFTDEQDDTPTLNFDA